jgi:hypothetical protein
MREGEREGEHRDVVVSGRPAAGGGRWVDVAPERLERWLLGFADRHGAVSAAPGSAVVLVTAADGALAEVTVPFPPLVVDDTAPYGGLVVHALAQRTVGVLLVRLGGHAAGVFRGPQLIASKVGSRHVQGRSAAGGWSQQRFARRRQGQAKVALEAAADVAVRVLLPAAADLQGLVLGGDRRTAAEVLGDQRLAPLRGLVVAQHLDVPDPRLRVLEQTPPMFRAVRIRVVEPE